MNNIRRIRYKGVFIQSMMGASQYLAWSSEQPTTDAVRGSGIGYFDFGATEAEAIDKVKAELDGAGDGK